MHARARLPDGGAASVAVLRFGAELGPTPALVQLTSCACPANPHLSAHPQLCDPGPRLSSCCWNLQAPLKLPKKEPGYTIRQDKPASKPPPAAGTAGTATAAPQHTAAPTHEEAQANGQSYHSGIENGAPPPPLPLASVQRRQTAAASVHASAAVDIAYCTVSQRWHPSMMGFQSCSPGSRRHASHQHGQRAIG